MKIECTRFREIKTGTFVGFADIYLPELAIEIFGCTLHKKGDMRWINLPVRTYNAKDGDEKYSPIVRFRDPITYTEFCTDAKIAIDDFISKGKIDAL